MEYFTILRQTVDEWQKIAGVDADATEDLRTHLRGLVTEIDAGHKGQRFFAIWVNPALSEPEQLQTIGHELCHIDRQHLDRYGLRHQVAEAEAKEHADEYADRYKKGEFDKWNIKR